MYCIQICRLPSRNGHELIVATACASPFAGFSTLIGMEFNGILLFWMLATQSFFGFFTLIPNWIHDPIWWAYFSLGLVFRSSLLIETLVAIYSTDPELMSPVPSLCPMQLLPLRPSFASCAAHGATLERDCKFSRRWEGHLNGMVPSVFVWFSKTILVVLYVLLNYVYINLCILMILREIDILFICHVCNYLKHHFCLRNISLPGRDQ